MKKNLFHFLLILLAASVSYYFLGQKSFSAPQLPQDVEKITLGVSLGDYDKLTFIAEKEGFFAEEGLEVDLQQYDTALPAVEDLVTGIIDVAAAEDFLLADYAFEHKNLDAFAAIAFTNHESIIARKDRNIGRPSDLKGKKIGVTKKTKAEYFLWHFLIARDIAMSEVEVVFLDPEELEEALRGGTIDAASISEPYASNIKEALGKNAFRWGAKKEQYFYYLLISNENWLKENPKQAERLLRALLKAEKHLQKKEFIVTLPQELLLVMEEEARWIIRHGRRDTSSPPNYFDHIYFDALQTVKPERISIIH